MHALRDVSVVVERGDFVAIMGASGSGKSTLMNMIGCLDLPTAGRYLIDGVDVREIDEGDLAYLRNRGIGLVFQSYNLVPRTSALRNVELPLIYARVAGRERRERALAALEAVGLSDRQRHLPSELSGGQQQRVAIARAIVTNPRLILADEPTGNLDSAATREVLEIFTRLNDEGRTIVMITHEQHVADSARRVLRLSDGRVVARHRARRGAARLGGRGPGSAGMTALEALRMAVQGLISNRLRSLLTMLGITIGVASVIVLVAVGHGSAVKVNSQIESLGTNTLTVMPGGGFGFGGRGGPASTQQSARRSRTSPRSRTSSRRRTS